MAFYPTLLLLRLTPHVHKVVADHQCGCWCNRLPTDYIFCSICQILDKKWEYSGAMHQIFIDLKKVCDSFRREVLCNILTEFGIPMKLIRLIIISLNETYSKIWIGQYLSDTFLFRMVWNEMLYCRCFPTLLYCAVCHMADCVTQWATGPSANACVQEGQVAICFGLHGGLDVLVDTIQISFTVV